MICTDDVAITENDPAFAPGTFNGKSAGLPCRMDQLNYINYMQLF
jgi:hypothetical protein